MLSSRTVRAKVSASNFFLHSNTQNFFIGTTRAKSLNYNKLREFIYSVSRFIPESTRYLLLKGKVAETEEILREIATTNKKEYPNEPLFNPSADGQVQQMGDVRDLFRTKKMLHRTLVSWYAW